MIRKVMTSPRPSPLGEGVKDRLLRPDRSGLAMTSAIDNPLSLK